MGKILELADRSFSEVYESEKEQRDILAYKFVEDHETYGIHLGTLGIKEEKLLSHAVLGEARKCARYYDVAKSYQSSKDQVINLVKLLQDKENSSEINNLDKIKIELESQKVRRDSLALAMVSDPSNYMVYQSIVGFNVETLIKHAVMGEARNNKEYYEVALAYKAANKQIIECIAELKQLGSSKDLDTALELRSKLSEELELMKERRDSLAYEMVSDIEKYNIYVKMLGIKEEKLLEYASYGEARKSKSYDVVREYIRLKDEVISAVKQDVDASDKQEFWKLFDENKEKQDSLAYEIVSHLEHYQIY